MSSDRYVNIGQLSIDRQDKLGKGGEGMVFKGKFKGIDIAVKETTSSYEEDILVKVDNHPNILRFYCKEKDDNYMYIGTELCVGTLEDIVVHKTYDGPPVGDNKEILRQITSGLAHLHSHKVIHGDLKPRNILISAPSGTTKPMVKLADFGHSRRKEGFALDRSFTRTVSSNGAVRPFGTESWMAPEIVNEDRYSFFSDIFPLGLIFAYTLNDGKHPFGDDIGFAEYNIKNKKPMIATVEQLDKEFPGAFELIKSMLNPDPKARPKAREILDKSFFTDRDLEFYKLHYLNMFS